MARSKILSWFLFRRFFYGVGLVLLIVCGIIFAITFVERLPSNTTFISALTDSWTRLIEYVPLFLPLAVFMGTLVAYYTMTRSSEGIIISSAGLSPYQIGRPFLFGAFLIGLFATMVINPYSIKLSSKNMTNNHFKLIDGRIWLRESSDNGYITIKSNEIGKNDQGIIFGYATVYIQNQEFKLTSRIDARHIFLTDQGLHADNVKIFDANGPRTQDKWSTKTLITPQTVIDRYLKPDQISFWRLPAFISKMSSIGVSTRGHLVQFWSLLFLPLSMIAMTSLGIAFSQTRQRRNHSFGTKFAIGILTCFILYFLTNIFTTLGANGSLPPLLAIIAPPIIIIAAAGIFITTFDTI